ncbi:MAG: hypothetical protein ABI690_12345 [Chloroflexota bacterium]
MPIQAVWDDESHTIIRYMIEGHWTWDEMNAAVAVSNAWLDVANRKIDFIHDMSRSEGIPAGALTQLKRYIGKEHPKTGHSVVIGPQKSVTNSVARGLLDMIQKLYKRDWGFMFAESLDDARMRLAESHNVNDPK